jgi:alanyl-tRNA synthetase
LIASSIAARQGHVALLFSVPSPSAVVIARAPDVSLDCTAILARLMTTFGGKGGGRPALAQGGGLQGEINALLATARGLLDSAAIGG